MLDLLSLHLQLLAWAVVQLFREEAVRAAHVANRSHQDIQQHRRKRLTQSQPRVTFQKLSRRVIHLDSKYSIKLQPHSYDFLTKTKLNRYAIHLALSNL